MTRHSSAARGDLPQIDRLLALSERAHERLGGVSIERMGGDNLAITLCSHFDDGEGDNDENGWTEAATAGYEETVQAIRDHYQPVFDEYASAINALLAERDAASARVGEMREALEPFANWATSKLRSTSRGQPDSQEVFAHNYAKITLGDLRRARLARGEG